MILNRTRSLMLAAVTTLALAGGAWAHEAKLGALTLSNLTVKPSLNGVNNTAGYLMVMNAGPADRLVSASCDCAKTVEIHRMARQGGVMRMAKVEGGMEVPAKGMLNLAPGGDHLMLLGLKAPLKEGTDVTMTLTFAKAGSVTTKFHVKTPAPAAAMDHGAMPGMKH